MRAPAVAIVAVVALLGVLYRDFLADDAFITLAFARTLVETGSPSLGGQSLHAISSPLWFGLSTMLIAVFGTELAPALLKLASAGGTVAAGLLLLLLARRFTSDARLQALAVVLLLADAWLGRWSWSGMEASWAVAAALGGLLFREQRRGLEAAILLGTVGVQLRPELGGLGVLLMAEAVWVDARSPAAALPSGQFVRRIVQGLAVAVVLYIGWGVAALHWFGTVEPQSASAKAGVLTPLASAIQAAKVIGVGQGLALLLIVAGGKAGLQRAAVPLLWLGVLVGFYAARGYEPLSRYLLLGTVALPAYAVAGLDRRWALPAGAAAIAVGGLVTLRLALPTSSGDMVRFYEDVVDEVPSGSRLATWEIGALGYYGDLELVDFAGLILPSALAEVADRPRALLRRTRPRYTLTRYEIDGLRYREVLAREVRSTRASHGSVTARATLWELDWAGVPP